MIHAPATSGGKDSTALCLWLIEQGIEFTPVFCDTGWEHPLTYAYLEELNRRIFDGRLVKLKPGEWVPAGVTEKYDDMRDLIARKGTIPSAKRRFCTQYLKTQPMRAWIAAQDDEVLVYDGKRAEESEARAALLVDHPTPDSRVFADYYDAWVVRPILRWTWADVFAIADRHGIASNPLYRLGSKRVGCFPCVMTRHRELKRLSAMLPEVWDRIAELEALAGSTFFPPDYIPERFCSGRDAEGHTFPTTEDVRRYLIDADEAQLALYGDTPSCMSVYNLCGE